MGSISDEELAAALAEAVDQEGVDQRLSKTAAQMTPEDVEASERNIRRWVTAARRGRGAGGGNPPAI